MTTGEMIKEIYDSTAGKYTKTAAVQNIGTATGASSTIGVAKFAPQYYSQLTIDNFFVILSSFPMAKTAYGGRGNTLAKCEGFTIKKSYDASTGILTVTGLVTYVRNRSSEDTYDITGLATVTLSATVYLVIPND